MDESAVLCLGEGLPSVEHWQNLLAYKGCVQRSASKPWVLKQRYLSSRRDSSLGFKCLNASKQMKHEFHLSFILNLLLVLAR